MSRSLCWLFRALLMLCAAPSLLVAAPAAQPFKILCSFYPIYVMALNVAGDIPHTQVECLAEPFVGCLHDYQLTPADLKTLGSASVFVANGAGMESFLEKALSQVPTLKVIEATKGMELAFNNNPHAWLSITGAIQETRTIARGLAAVDPGNAVAYLTNANRYAARLEELGRKMHAALDPLSGREIITFHEAFPYFAREFNLKIVGVVEREPGSEPSAGELAQTIRTVRSSKVKALFAEPQYSAKSAEIIHRETGVPVRFLDPAVTGPREPAAARDAYVAAMEKNQAALLEAFKD